MADAPTALSTAAETGTAPDIAVCRAERDRLAALVASMPECKDRQRHVAGLTAMGGVVRALESYEAATGERLGARASVLHSAMACLRRYCQIYGLDAASKSRAEAKDVLALLSVIKVVFATYVPLESRGPAFAELEDALATSLKSKGLVRR